MSFGADLPGASTTPASPTARFENAVAISILCAMAVLPLLEIAGRHLWRTGVPGSAMFVQHGTFWIAFLGAAIAAREGNLLALGAAANLLPARFKAPIWLCSSAVAAAVAALLCVAGVDLVLLEREGGSRLLAHFPVWVAEAVMPVGSALIAWRLLRRAAPTWRGRVLGALAAAVGVGVILSPLPGHPTVFLAALVLLLAAAVFGAPVFAILGGLAILLFRHADVPLASIPAEMYRLVTSPALPTIPLFAFAGYLLAAGGASHRLLRFFRALFGWMPGAIAVVTVLACTFFTTFTGASGVTIVALGGLLLPALVEEGYKDRFSIGLLTSSGALGLLFPPCLPVILYAVMAGIAIDRMFLGGILPGLLLVLLILAFALRSGFRMGRARRPFSLVELGGAFLEAKWEILFPVLVILGIFGGFATMVETAAFAVLYVLVVGTVVHRDISLRRDFPRIGTEAATLIGGVLIVMAAAMGLTSYLVDAGIPAEILSWVRATIHSRVVFLLALNVFLLLVGALMNVFSAIVVIVPIVAPMAAAFGIDPVHLGIIFLANLELGYLTPPVGMNLYLAAYRFKRPLGEVVASIVPFYLILLAGVLAITYIPWLTIALQP
ncbi:MAG: TRAP transporter large permease subunit [Candidatus Methylomirabilia bacterium]